MRPAINLLIIFSTVISLFAGGAGTLTTAAAMEGIDQIRQKAEQGDADAQFKLGAMYQTGYGVALDDKEAMKWFHLAVERGNAYAQDKLGDMYYSGEGLLPDDKEAMKWYRQATAQGDPSAQQSLRFMEKGIITVAQPTESPENIYTFQDYTVRIYPLNKEEGIQRLEILKGDQLVHRMWSGQLSVGYDQWKSLIGEKDVDIHLVEIGKDITGKGIPNLLVEDWSGGAHCCFRYHIFEIGKEFRKIAVVPIGEAYYCYFEKQRQEKGLVVKGHDDVFAYWRTSFASSPALKIVLRFKDGRYRLAPDLMREPAPAEDVFKERKNQVTAGWGQPGSSPPQPPSLWSFMLKLIYSGHADMARRFFDEAWPAKEPGRISFAADFYSQLAASKYWRDLSDFYPELEGNRKEAVKQCHEAAAQGDPDAQFILGGIYAEGRGMAQDYAEAYAWYELALAANQRGPQEADIMRARDRLRQKMTPEQIAAGEQRAKALRAGFERK